MISVSPNDLFDFICAWFHDREMKIRQESSHVILSISELPDNIAIATHLDPMATGTVRALLRKCGIPKDEFESIMASRRTFKAFLKHPGKR